LKKLVLPLFLIPAFILLNGCSKNKSCEPRTPASETAEIQAFATAKGINASVDPSGVYYQIMNPGGPDKPNASSKIVITYTGQLLNGQVFDQMNTPNQSQPWTLGTLIPGWVTGLPHIGKGGSIKLIIPSSLAYGCMSNGVIPSNSILYFEIQLVDFM
jgi:FKBP-type peptidyl-prolyl cis-trans isomerases 1